MAQDQINLIQVARDHLEQLSSLTGDTVHMGILDNDQALYLDKVPGRRRIMISSRVGDRQPLTSTGLGKALMIDHQPSYWMDRFEKEQAVSSFKIDRRIWSQRMKAYAEVGRAYDLEENEDQIRCVAAPIRDVSRKIVGAISVSSAAQYMDDERMEDLTSEVIKTARAISQELGWSPPKI
jgi:DNA-binding IclR family transcriptional regulator